MSEERLEAVCPSCGFESRVPLAAVGRTARCPRCQTGFRIEGVHKPQPASNPLEGPPATTPEAPAATTPEPAPPATTGSPPTGGWRTGEVVLGLYEVTGLLGQGGMGRVYKVRHRGWGLDLAVKTPLPEILEAAGGAAAFEGEAETWVNLGLHPHVVTCHYVRRIHGTPCVFAEFANGGSLHERISSDRPGLETLLDQAIQFAWGLAYAHEQGLVHRDVKPANVLLTSDGIVKVTDFGLARGGPLTVPVSREGGTMVVAGGAAGTPAYMSPEQLAGKPLTRRSDLWSWALSVLEMFAGGRNWDYGSAALASLEEYLAHSPPAGLPRMPAMVAELLRRSFHEDPAGRPHDLDEAARALSEAYRDGVGRAYPRSPPRASRDSADSLNNGAVSLLDLDRSHEAVTLWTRALEADPQHLEATFNWAVHEWARGRLDDGELERRFGEALKSHASEPRAHHLAARLSLALGDFGRSAMALDEALGRGGSAVELAHDRALALAGQAAASDDRTAWGCAREALEQTLALVEPDPISVAARAFTLDKLGEGAAATAFYREATARHSGLPLDLDVAVHTLVPGLERTSTMRGLSGSVGALAVTPDGAQIVAGGGGREARVWEHGAATPVRKLISEDGRLRALAIAPDARTLLWAAEDAPLRVFDVLEGRLVRAFPRTGGSSLCLAITPDGQHAVTGSSDRQVRVFDLASGQCVRTLEGHDDAVLAVAAGETRIVSGGRDGTVRVWDAGTGRVLAVLRGHAGRVNAVALDEPRRRLASGSEDRSVRLWRWDAEGPPIVWLGPTQAVTCVAFEPRGRFLVSGSLDRGLRFHDLDTGSLHATVRLDAAIHSIVPAALELVLGHGSTVSRVAVPEQPRLPAPALARPLSSVEAQQRQGDFEARLAKARAHLDAGDLEEALDAARAARAIPGFGRAASALAVWTELADRLPRASLAGAWEDKVLARHEDQVLALAAAKEFVVSASTDKTIQLCAKDGSEARVLGGHEGPVSALAVIPGTRLLASGGWDATIRVWSLPDGKPRGVHRGHTGYVVALAVSPDGRRLASGSLDQTVRLWQRAGVVERTLQGHQAPVAAVAFSPDGRVVVSGSWDGTLCLWDADSGAAIAALAGHRGNLNAVAVAPTGLLFASGGADATLRLWDARARRESAVLEGHGAAVTALAFTADGRFLVSASRDGTARVWSVAEHRPVRVLDHPAPLLAAALMAGDHQLATGGVERAVRSWHLDWEPEPRLRLKPQTIRPQPQTTPPAPTLRDSRPRPSPPAETAWNDVAKTASRTMLRAPAAVRKPLPWKRIAQTAAALAIAGASVMAWRGTRRGLHVVEPVAEALRAEPDLIRIDAFRDQCGVVAVADLLERVRTPDVSAPDIACLAASHDPGVVSAYFQTMSLEDTDALRVKRRLRNAVSLMAGLGEPAAEILCTYLGDPRDDLRGVAALALSVQGTPTARACLQREMKAGASGLARATAVSSLPQLLARGQIGPVEGFALVQDRLGDPDPQVKTAALATLSIFDADHARPLAEAARGDADEAVRRAADAALQAIAAARTGEALRGGQ